MSSLYETQRGQLIAYLKRPSVRPQEWRLSSVKDYCRSNLSMTPRAVEKMLDSLSLVGEGVYYLVREGHVCVALTVPTLRVPAPPAPVWEGLK